ncbi:thioredoxin family protein [Microbacterium sp. LRZ72]|uniref:thioredoxin family protein n=1 Tax=Microbacterium sp. LRZ72 TaxID=2942481 RepID=UPI0029BE6176|nr:thioredoxin family protein [Microbacterium sp. LRZ72]MDX2377618.1 thioredoxin family protein [Microbacterium sp. LRZ72]
MEITLQYFDGCPNWEVLDNRLAEAVDGQSDVRVTRQLVETAEDAERLGFHGSPTVLIDGVDPFSDEHATVGLACRVFRTPAGFAGSPTVTQLRVAISAQGSEV